MSKGTNINALNGQKSFLLMKLIEAEYTSSGMNFPAFAVYATGKLGFPVNADHIRNRCSQMGILPNTRNSGFAGETMGLAVRVQALEDEVQRLSNYIQYHLARTNVHSPSLKDYK